MRGCVKRDNMQSEVNPGIVYGMQWKFKNIAVEVRAFNSFHNGKPMAAESRHEWL